jgi:hypothetical protein
MGYEGQIRFADAVLIKGGFRYLSVPSLFPPRTDARLYRDRNGRVRGRKFYFHGQPASGNLPLEVCAAASVFRLRLHFSNLVESELGLLLLALGQGDSPMDLKLGGAKPVCCGSMEVQVKTVQTRDGTSDALDWDSTGCPEKRVRWLAAARELVAPESLKALQSIWAPGRPHTCPSLPY